MLVNAWFEIVEASLKAPQISCPKIAFAPFRRFCCNKQNLLNVLAPQSIRSCDLNDRGDRSSSQYCFKKINFFKQKITKSYYRVSMRWQNTEGDRHKRAKCYWERKTKPKQQINKKQRISREPTVWIGDTIASVFEERREMRSAFSWGQNEQYFLKKNLPPEFVPSKNAISWMSMFWKSRFRISKAIRLATICRWIF